MTRGMTGPRRYVMNAPGSRSRKIPGSRGRLTASDEGQGLGVSTIRGKGEEIEIVTDYHDRIAHSHLRQCIQRTGSGDRDARRSP